MHQSGLRALNGLLSCSMSLVFTFLCVTKQAKALTLDETLDFHKNLVVWKEIESDKLDKIKNELRKLVLHYAALICT